MGFEIFVALRYLFSRKEGLFTFLTSIIGVAGVAVGVAALITTLGVMTGFQSDIKERVIGAQSHILISGDMSESFYKEKIKEIEQISGVAGAAPNIGGQAILNRGNSSLGVVLRGIDPQQESKINNLMKSFEEGSFTAQILPAEKDAPAAIVLGVELASNMGIDVGDDVVLISPSSIASSAGMVPKMKKFRVSGTIKTGYYEFDSTMVYTDLKSAGDFLDLENSVTGIAVKLKNIDAADKIAKQIKPLFGPEFTVRTFSEMNATLYAALKLEKIMMFIILSLIILVAALNIASNLILLGTEKLKDIGLMRAMGANPFNISKIFIFEGLLTGTFGLICGLLLSMLLCWVITTFNFVQLPGDVFYLTKIPVKLQPADIFAVVLGTYFLCFAAALYPALRASKVNPADAIRYG
ncbi:MAG: ABC transporter permease [Elusimicrobium sp.]|jgi:lipoprotein-releasing system permease protein|nr:ABC transporter permease [Elusimicrobium sp.]